MHKLAVTTHAPYREATQMTTNKNSRSFLLQKQKLIWSRKVNGPTTSGEELRVRKGTLLSPSVKTTTSQSDNDKSKINSEKSRRGSSTHLLTTPIHKKS